jgi:antitoxin component of MazEF toxin-antitoxin module
MATAIIKNRSIPISAKMLKQLGLKEGDKVETRLKVKTKELIITPKKNGISLRTIKRKMKEHTGLTREEMEIAAEAGLIRRDQFYHWTPESQQELKEIEADYDAGKFKRFTSLEALFKDLDEA